MGYAVAEAILRAGLPLVPMTITGDPKAVTEKQKSIAVNGNNIQLIGLEDRTPRLSLLKEQYPNLIVVDYTAPSCMNGKTISSK